tara:strand:- start:651 stop:845 length:195 start_codon:yes stop_codon:yes gene_type:complete
MDQLTKLKKELKRLLGAEEKLLDFLIYNPDYKEEAVKKIFEVSELILQMKRIIAEIEKDLDSGD